MWTRERSSVEQFLRRSRIAAAKSLHAYFRQHAGDVLAHGCRVFWGATDVEQTGSQSRRRLMVAGLQSRPKRQLQGRRVLRILTEHAFCRVGCFARSATPLQRAREVECILRTLDEECAGKDEVVLVRGCRLAALGQDLAEQQPCVVVLGVGLQNPLESCVGSVQIAVERLLDTEQVVLQQCATADAFDVATRAQPEPHQHEHDETRNQRFHDTRVVCDRPKPVEHACSRIVDGGVRQR